MVFLGLEKFDKMVLITQKEIREGSTVPPGTILFVYNGGEQHSVQPEEASYRYYQAVYVDWKKRQADKVRRQRDQVVLAERIANRGEEEPKLERQTLALPGTPPLLAHVDDLSLPFQQFYQAEAVEGDVIAYAEVSPYRSRYGCYSIHTRFDKVKPGGTMGRRQTERARLLRNRLVSLVEELLQTAGWRRAFDEPGTWRWEGQSIIEQERQLVQLALKTWRGRARREGNEKVADLPDDLAQTVEPLKFHLVPANETLEYLIDPDARLLRVRRRSVIPSPVSKPREASQLVLGIIGDEEARQRGAAPAYHRTISTRKVSFTCQGCKQTVTQERLPGPTPRYCSDTCQGEARRQKTLERVRRLREQRRKNKQKSPTPTF